MSSSQKPVIAVGEYAAPQQVEFPGLRDGEFAGTYTIELGAEFKDATSFSNKNARRRSVRVDGYAFDMYAMIHEEGPRLGRRYATDCRILRDVDQLNTRAIEWYIHRVLVPKRKQELLDEAERQSALSFQTTDNWRINVGDTSVTIDPIGIELWMPWTSDPNDHSLDETRAQRVAILERVMTLMKRHGLRGE